MTACLGVNTTTPSRSAGTGFVNGARVNDGRGEAACAPFEPRGVTTWAEPTGTRAMDVRNGAVAGRMRRAERGVGAPARPTPRMGHESALGGRSKPSSREISVNDACSRSADQPL